jgi:hypothetical protein
MLQANSNICNKHPELWLTVFILMLIITTVHIKLSKNSYSVHWNPQLNHMTHTPTNWTNAVTWLYPQQIIFTQASRNRKRSRGGPAQGQAEFLHIEEFEKNVPIKCLFWPASHLTFLPSGRRHAHLSSCKQQLFSDQRKYSTGNLQLQAGHYKFHKRNLYAVETTYISWTQTHISKSFYVRKLEFW